MDVASSDRPVPPAYRQQPQRPDNEPGGGSRPPMSPPNRLLAQTHNDAPAVALAATVYAPGEHPPYSVDCPNEPHIDADGACWCCGGCCCDEDGRCTCKACGGRRTGCFDHDA